MMMIATATAGRTDKRDRASTQNGQSEIVSVFWQQWLEHEKLLYNCCLKLMDWNPTEAEDALSTARLKAWKKVQEFGDSIRNFKAWLIELTRNLCLDIIKKRSRGPVAVENIELAGDGEVLCTASTVASPQMVLEAEEQYVTIRRAVASLPQKMRDTFVLHYYEGLNHKEIAEQQGISYDSVCKRISLARKQLETKLRGYFRDEKNLATALEPAGKKSSTPVAQVEKRKIQSDNSEGKETATVSAARDCAPVEEKAKPSLKNGAVSLAHMGSERKEVSANESARSRSQTPVAQVEKPRTIQSHDSEGKEILTVSAARECILVEAGEKPDFVKCAVAQWARRGEKIKEVCAKGSARSPAPTPLAIVEKPTIHSQEETHALSTTWEWVPVVVEAKPSNVKRAAAKWALFGQKIEEVCAKVSVRSRSQIPLAQEEKPTMRCDDSIKKEIPTVLAARECLPVAVRLRSPLVYPEKAEQHLWRANALVDTVCGSTPLTPSFVAEFDTG